METRKASGDPLLVERWNAVAVLTLGVLFGAGGPSVCAADSPSDFRLRLTGAGGLVLSADQHALYGYELPVVEMTARAGWVVAEPLVLELGIGAGGYFAKNDTPGGLLEATLGAEVGVQEGTARVWLSVHAGGGLTGLLVRPVLRIALGVDVSLDEVVTLGPTLGYTHVFQLDGPDQSDDAIALSLGLTLSIRPRLSDPPSPSPPAPPRRAARITRLPLPDPAPPPMPTEQLMGMLDEAAGLAPRELLVPVLFAFDSTDIVPCTLPSLYRLREHLAEHPEIELLEIEGHADGQGNADYNIALGLRRAEAIRNWLVERGVEPERLRIGSRGESHPQESDGDAGGAFQNRRALFLVRQEAR